MAESNRDRINPSLLDRLTDEGPGGSSRFGAGVSLSELRKSKRVLFEAAQGSLLDVDHGSYPYVTSSNSSVAGVWSGSGVPSRNLERVIGVIKAYTTRVGGGPCPTELTDGPTGIELGRHLGQDHRVAVLFMTANPGMVRNGVAGTIGVLSKPTDEDAVRNSVDYALGKASGNPPPLAPPQLQVFA